VQHAGLGLRQGLTSDPVTAKLAKCHKKPTSRESTKLHISAIKLIFRHAPGVI
jgi:hypothetical protein